MTRAAIALLSLAALGGCKEAKSDPKCQASRAPSECCAGLYYPDPGGCNECECACGGGDCQWLCTTMACLDVASEAECQGSQAAGACCAGDPPSGCSEVNDCRCDCSGDGCLWQCTDIDRERNVCGPYPFSEVTLTPTEPPTATGVNDVAAFVPHWCASTTPGGEHVYGGTSLDCPALAALWPCRAFREPTPLVAALTPAAPMLEVAFRDDAWSPAPEGCTCDRGLYRATGFEGGANVACDSLAVLDASGPVLIDSPEALAARFAPVESAAEALAFVLLVQPGVAMNERVAVWYDANGLAATHFPDSDASVEPVCKELELQGASVQAWGDGYSVRAFVLGTTCANAGLSILSARVSTDGVVTLDGIQSACWYEQPPCVN